MKIFRFSVSVALGSALVAPATACDLCSIYSAAQSRGEVGRGFFAGIAEQFTHFGTMQDNGQVVPNPSGQYLDSSISQIFAGYNLSDRFGVQFNLPLIYRSFQRPDGFATDRGVESGLGDISILGNFRLLRLEEKNRTFSWHLLGGVKFPTGSSDRIREELSEVEIPGAPESGIHGHDLTLGTGSIDGIIGTGIFARYHRAFFSAGAQYSLRTKGDFDYRFANDLTWMGGPGYLVALNDNYTFALQLNVSGERKKTDTFQGSRAADTGVTAVYLGPQASFTWSDKFSAEIGADFPVSIANTALQTVPDYRVRASVTWRF